MTVTRGKHATLVGLAALEAIFGSLAETFARRLDERLGATDFKAVDEISASFVKGRPSKLWIDVREVEDVDDLDAACVAVQFPRKVSYEMRRALLDIDPIANAGMTLFWDRKAKNWKAEPIPPVFSS